MTKPEFDPDDFDPMGGNCPCCGAAGDYDEIDVDHYHWDHRENPDGCTWKQGDYEPCPRWPHGRDMTSEKEA